MNKRILPNKRKYEGTIRKSNLFGNFKVMEYYNSKKVKIQFINTGYIAFKTLADILKGLVQDKLAKTVYGLGCIGDGDYSTSNNGVKEHSYKTWKNMFDRCYHENADTLYPCYKGCSVSEEWHNFQNFAKWYEENYVEGYQLDKDIKVEGNRVYGPTTCMFVQSQKNAEAACAKHYKLVNPEGEVVEIYNLAQFCRENDLNASSMCNVASGVRKSNKGWTKYTPEEE